MLITTVERNIYFFFCYRMSPMTENGNMSRPHHGYDYFLSSSNGSAHLWFLADNSKHTTAENIQILKPT